MTCHPLNVVRWRHTEVIESKNGDGCRNKKVPEGETKRLGIAPKMAQDGLFGFGEYWAGLL